MYNIVTLQQKGQTLPDLSLIMLGAGSSSRFKRKVRKQWLRIGDIPLWLYATKRLTSYTAFKQVIVVCAQDEIEYIKNFDEDITFVIGGETRQESLQNALLHVNTSRVLVSDVARVCIPLEMLQRIMDKTLKADIIVPYLPVSDTVVYKDDTIDRGEVKLIQTPQLSKTKILKQALETKTLYTDDSSAIKALGGKIHYVLGAVQAQKLTFNNDLKLFETLQAPSSEIFVGNGFDVHAFEEGKEMWLGGIKITQEYGFKAHSDGDVAIHALIDALLGAIGGGDIGELFPDTSSEYKDIDSKILLEKVVTFINRVGYEIIHCDITIMAQKPKLQEFKKQIKQTLASYLHVKPLHVNIKATTTEKLGFVGRQEGVAVSATVTVKYHNWKYR
jgi:2-C-methyl-D-erythritol 4-phosphate cytidylyltransferase/2-C-methyl-D-erythritol 2,4-cyclodiphosphate synthase